MIVCIPAIYFSLLLLYIIKRNGFDISACIISVYLFTAICSVILYYDWMNTSYKFNYEHGDISLVPTIIYCSMITLVTIPFIRFNSNQKRSFYSVNIKTFNLLSYCFIFSFLFCLILFKDDLLFRLALGDTLGEMRGVELENAQSKLSGPLRFLSTVASSICSVSSICIILFLYSVTYLKKPWWFNLILFISSLGCIILGIMGIDRSISFYWIINFFFISVLFKPFLSKKIKRMVFLFGAIALFAIGSFLVTLSLSRFGNMAVGSLLEYMGQNYINFCWFWDNYEAPVMNFGIFCPILSHFFIDWGYPVSAVPFGLFVESKVGYFVNVFYTFMGTIMLYLGQWAVIPFCILYYNISSKFLKLCSNIKFSTILIIFIVAIIPYDGVILYLFVDYVKAFGFISIICFCAFINRKQIITSGRMSINIKK